MVEKTVFDLKINHVLSVHGCNEQFSGAWNSLELIKNKYCHIDGSRRCNCSNNTLFYFKIYIKNCNQVIFKCNISVKARDRKMDISIEWPLYCIF